MKGVWLLCFRKGLGWVSVQQAEDPDSELAGLGHLRMFTPNREGKETKIDSDEEVTEEERVHSCGGQGC